MVFFYIILQSGCILPGHVRMMGSQTHEVRCYRKEYGAIPFPNSFPFSIGVDIDKFITNIFSIFCNLGYTVLWSIMAAINIISLFMYLIALKFAKNRTS